MIKYTLICGREHEFEVWFSKSSDFDEQASESLISCPHCGDTHVEKAIMAPNISTARGKAKIAKAQTGALKKMSEFASAIRQEIASNCEDVGSEFAEEARAIHYGEKEERGIYGTTTKGEAEALFEEGISAIPLPDVCVPRPTKKLN